MASPSSSTTTFCFQCEDSSNSVTFRNGWRLRSGKFAQLCHRCACGRVVTPLFQKSLSASDADLALSRLVIPKKCAEAYFPPLSGPHKIPINILDTDGKEWNFHFRFWPNSRSKMYVLEGLRDYMVSKKWQAGDVDAIASVYASP
uniref:Transcription factor n=1 Tax=Solanum tuberosum TaxID=4113 RepID=M1CC79_SOLTU